MKKIIKWSKT